METTLAEGRRKRANASTDARITKALTEADAATGTAPGAPELSANSRRKRAASPLGADVARELERLIVEGVLRPGERLNELALARKLGVSRGPVREAARALEKTGLVTVIMNRGAFVRQLDLDEAMAIYEVNAVLFGLAAGQAAEALTSAAALQFSAMVEEMDRAVAAGDRDRFFATNVRFHAAIMAASRNREAETLYHGYTRKLLLLRRRSFEREGHMARSNAEHRAVLEAILAGDGARARAAAEAHARAGRGRFLESIGHAGLAAPAEPAPGTTEDRPHTRRKRHAPDRPDRR